jgi:hypothetical protein
VRTPGTTGSLRRPLSWLRKGAVHGCRAREPPETIGRQQPHAAACAEFRALASRGRCSAPVRGGDGRWREAEDHGREAHGACAAAHAKFQSGRSTHGRLDRPPAVQDAAEVESRARPSGVRGAGQTGPDASVDAHGASGTRPTRLRAAVPATQGVHRRGMGAVRHGCRPTDRSEKSDSLPTRTLASAGGAKRRRIRPQVSGRNSVVATQIGRAEEAIQRSSRRTNRGRSS